MEPTTEHEHLELFNPAAALNAQIRSGYKSTDHALAEIIDNSIEAGAKHIDVYVVQGYVPPENRAEGSRGHKGIRRIITIDDGSGISKEILSRVLSFGFGTHLDQTDSIIDGYGKLGKFGYGLPNASVCTADDIHVWSWTNSVDEAFNTRLDVDAIIRHRAKSQTPAVKEPLPNDILNLVRAAGFRLGNSGTIVDWNKVVRTTWKRPSTLIDHIEETVGRIFRHFIYNQNVEIRIFTFDENALAGSAKALHSQIVRVNDPLFLMKGSLAHSFLKPEDQEKDIFEAVPVKPARQSNRRPSWSDGKMQYIDVPLGDGKTARITIRYSVCTKMARNYGGSSALGALARRNSGVSICRGGRELSLSPSWIPTQDAIERWWGCEIDFPPALDDMFGVTNNKQSAPNLDAFATVTPDQYLEEYRDTLDNESKDKVQALEDVIASMRANGESEWLSFLIRYFVYKQTRELMKNVVKPLGKSDDAPVNSNGVPVASSSGSFSKAVGIVSETHPVLKNKDENKPNPDHFLPANTSDKNKQDILNWLETDNSVLYKSEALGNGNEDQLFTQISEMGRYFIIFNENHPAYPKLFGNLDLIIDKRRDGELLAKPLTAEQVEVRMDQVRTTLALFIFSLVKAQDNFGTATKQLQRYINKVGEELNDLMIAFDRDLKEDGNTGGAAKEYNGD